MIIQKLIVALAAVFIIATAMTGIAAADVFITDNPIVNPLNGDTETTTTVTITNIQILGDRYISVKTSNENLQAMITGNGVDTGWTTDADDAGRVGGTYTATEQNDYTFTLHVRGTQEGFVTVGDNAGTTHFTQAVTDTASCTRKVEIPEFATIAIPAAAIIGLFLFFNHRKRGKE